MAFYTPTTGIITNISVQNTQSTATNGCTLFLTVQSEDHGLINILLPGRAYVLNGRPFQIGDRATFFYQSQAPAPLIFPPQYRAVAAACTPHGLNAALDVFNALLTNTENSLMLNMSGNVPIVLPNGQPFRGDLAGKLLLVIYGATTRSIPAQTIPSQIVVFCSPV